TLSHLCDEPLAVRTTVAPGLRIGGFLFPPGLQSTPYTGDSKTLVWNNIREIYCSMIRNIPLGGRPFPHFRVKSRVLTPPPSSDLPKPPGSPPLQGPIRLVQPRLCRLDSTSRISGLDSNLRGS